MAFTTRIAVDTIAPAPASIADPEAFGSAVQFLGGLECVLKLGELHLRHRDDDLVLGLELVVDGAFRDSGGIGDHLIGRRAYAVFSEELQCRTQGTHLRGGARG